VDIEFGNAGALDTNNTGWFVGFSDWTKANIADVTNLRFMEKDALAQTIHMKWMVHPANDPRGAIKPPSEGRTLSILVSEAGRFRLEFSADDRFSPDQSVLHTLQSHGDFVVWGDRIYHRWFVDEACTILTLRWTPVQPDHP
jgi:hypothetical protein